MEEQLSLLSFRGRQIEYRLAWLELRRGAFTRVRWQITLCDLIWQVMLRSSETGLLLRYTLRDPLTFLTRYGCAVGVYGTVVVFLSSVVCRLSVTDVPDVQRALKLATPIYR